MPFSELQQEQMQRELQNVLGKLLKKDPDIFPLEEPFSSMGIAPTTLHQVIIDHFGISIPPSLFSECSLSITSLATYLIAHLQLEHSEAIKRLFNQKLQVMSRQLEILQMRRAHQFIPSAFPAPLLPIAMPVSLSLPKDKKETSRTPVTPPAREQRLEPEVKAVQLLPLSEQQKELWFMSLMQDEASKAYNQSLLLHIRGLLSVWALDQALQELIQRHEALRTTFDLQGGAQRIVPSLSFRLEQNDLSMLSPEEQQDTITRLREEETQRLFDLEHGPLMRAHLVKLGVEDHILFFTVHHIIADGRSLGILLDELSTFYTALTQGERPYLPAAALYSHYVRQQLEMAESAEMMDAKTYWLQEFATLPPMLELPTDYQRPPAKTFKGAKYIARLDASLYQALKKVSRQQNCTLYTLLLAGYVAFLARITGQRDLVVPISAAGHMFLDDESSLVGHCVKLLPLRITIQGNPTLKDYIQMVKQTLLAAQKHHSYPYTRLVQQLKIPRDASVIPLAATDFNVDQAGDLLFSDLDVDVQNNNQGFAQFEFSVNITQTQHGLLVEYTYNTDLFTEQTIQNWATYFHTLLDCLVQPSTISFSQLKLLNSEEAGKFALSQQDSLPGDRKSSWLFPLFQKQVKRTPDSIAVSIEKEQLTYAMLAERVNHMAWCLREMNVTTEVLVVLLAERSIDFLIAILATFQVGGAYLPLHPNWPEKQYAQVLESSQAKLILTTKSFRPKIQAAVAMLKKQKRTRISLFENIWRKKHTTKAVTVPICGPDNLAYVIYTSGSTGIPKGAMVEHKGMLNHLFEKVNELALTSGSVVAQNASQSFDISVWQFLSSLLVGGRIHIIPEAYTHNPMLLMEQVVQHGVTVLETVPSLLQGLFLQIEAGVIEIPDCTHLRWLISTGEALSPKLARQWLEIYPQIPLLNGYGPTECSDDVTHHVIAEPPAETALLVPIGHRLMNLELYVLDSDMQIVPPGIPGELYVGGIGVGRGYVREPARTATAFVPHPFHPEPGRRLYKTGDRVRYDLNGNLEFLGRFDQQVKVRGFRIELGEIDAHLRQHTAIQDSIVIVREDEPGNKRLIAYVVLIAGATANSKQLRSWMREQVPEYMVPSAFVLLERFPVTSNGKLDTRALPAPEQDQSPESLPGAAPRNSLESLLTEIWKSVLHVNEVGVHDNFFELGGDSIMSIKIIARLYDAGFKLTTREIFQYQTISELSNAIAQTAELSAEQGETTEQISNTKTDSYDTSLVDLDTQILNNLLSKVRFNNGKP